MEEKLQKLYFTDNNLLISQDLWQAHYQILLIISLKEFIKLNVNMDMIMKNVKTCGVKFKDCKCCLENTSVKDDLKECKCFSCNINYQKTLMKT